MVHKEGRITVQLAITSILLTGYIFYLYASFLFIPFLVIGLILLSLILWFFRVPDREIPMLSADDLLCPADGKIVVIEETFESEYLKEKCLQISIFMSPLNVHINWAPVSGNVVYNKHHPGKYLVAWHPKSSLENERTTTVISNDKHTILLRQIAGAMARRICNYASVNKDLSSGQEIGFIKFGSRVDVYLPKGTEALVKLGDKVKGSQTLLARLP